jgi:anti-anti-sigma factor
MAFEILDKEHYSLVKVLTSRLDTTNAPDLKSELVLMNSKGVKNIVLDLSSCTYCDSSGLRAVLVANRLCDDAVGTFVLCGLQPDVETLIRISMLHTVLLITKDETEAASLLQRKYDL